MNILLTADESAGYYAFQLITESEHTLSAVVAPLNHSALRKSASKLNIPVLEPSSLTKPSFAHWVREKKIDVLLNVHLLYVIHPDIIKALSVEAFNLHPGQLPEYAGLNTPMWAIYNLESEQTVTLHRIESGIDTGSIAYYSTFPIKPDDTGLTLSVRSAKKGVELIEKLLEDLSSDTSSIPAIPQDLSNRHYYSKKDKPQNGYIDWNKSSAEIDAFIRASNYHPFKSPWGFPKTGFNGSVFGISSVIPTLEKNDQFPPGRVGKIKGDLIPVATSDYWLLIKACYDGEKIVPAVKVLEEGITLK